MCVCVCVHNINLLLIIVQSSSSLSGEHVGLVHKKIRISDDLLSWEHERFALSKQSAATLSHHWSPADNSRHSIFDDWFVNLCVYA